MLEPAPYSHTHSPVHPSAPPLQLSTHNPPLIAQGIWLWSLRAELLV